MLKYLFQKTKTSGNISIKNRYKSTSWWGGGYLIR